MKRRRRWFRKWPRCATALTAAVISLALLPTGAAANQLQASAARDDFDRLMREWMAAKEVAQRDIYESMRPHSSRRAAELRKSLAEFKGLAVQTWPKMTAAAEATWKQNPGASPQAFEWLIGYMHHLIGVKNYQEVLRIADSLLSHCEHLSDEEQKRVIHPAAFTCLMMERFDTAKQYVEKAKQLGPLDDRFVNMPRMIERRSTAVEDNRSQSKRMQSQ